MSLIQSIKSAISRELDTWRGIDLNSLYSHRDILRASIAADKAELRVVERKIAVKEAQIISGLKP